MHVIFCCLVWSVIFEMAFFDSQGVWTSLFPFSSDAAHRAPDVLLSPDRLTVTRTSDDDYSSAWARSERGFPPACGAVKWAVKLGKEDGGCVYKVGVVSDAFTGCTEAYPKKSWIFQNNGIFVDGKRQGSIKSEFSLQAML